MDSIVKSAIDEHSYTNLRCNDLSQLPLCKNVAQPSKPKPVVNGQCDISPGDSKSAIDENSTPAIESESIQNQCDDVNCEPETRNYNKYNCQKCDFMSVSADVLGYHKHIQHSHSEDISPLEKYQLVHPESVYMVEKIAANTNDIFYICRNCDLKLYGLSNMTRHFYTTHNHNCDIRCKHCSYTLSVTALPEMMFQCRCRKMLKILPVIRHKRTETINVAINMHTNDSWDKGYFTHLNSHMHYLCCLCGKRYSNKDDISLHINLFHFDSMPYKCTYCTLTNASRLEIKKHTANFHKDSVQIVVCNNKMIRHLNTQVSSYFCTIDQLGNLVEDSDIQYFTTSPLKKQAHFLYTYVSQTDNKLRFHNMMEMKNLKSIEPDGKIKLIHFNKISTMAEEEMKKIMSLKKLYFQYVDSSIQVTPLVPLGLNNHNDFASTSPTNQHDDSDIEIIDNPTEKSSPVYLICLSSSDEDEDACQESVVAKTPPSSIARSAGDAIPSPSRALASIQPKTVHTNNAASANTQNNLAKAYDGADNSRYSAGKINVVIVNSKTRIPKDLNPKLNITNGKDASNAQSGSIGVNNNAHISFIDMSTAVPIKDVPHIVISDEEYQNQDSGDTIAIKTTIGLRQPSAKPRNTARKSTSHQRFIRRKSEYTNGDVNNGLPEKSPPKSGSSTMDSPTKSKNTARKSTSHRRHVNNLSPSKQAASYTFSHDDGSQLYSDTRDKTEFPNAIKIEKVDPTNEINSTIKKQDPHPGPGDDAKTAFINKLPDDYYGESAMEDPMIKAYYETLRLNQERRDEKTRKDKHNQERFNNKSPTFDHVYNGQIAKQINKQDEDIINDVRKSVGNLTSEEMNSLMNLDLDEVIFRKSSNTTSPSDSKRDSINSEHFEEITTTKIKYDQSPLKKIPDDTLDNTFQMNNETAIFEESHNYADITFDHLLNDDVPEKINKNEEKNDPDYNPNIKKQLVDLKHKKNKKKYNTSDSRESDLSTSSHDNMVKNSKLKIGSKRKIHKVTSSVKRPVGRPRKNFVKSKQFNEFYSSEDELPLTAITSTINKDKLQNSDEDIPLQSYTM